MSANPPVPADAGEFFERLHAIVDAMGAQLGGGDYRTIAARCEEVYAAALLSLAGTAGDLALRRAVAAAAEACLPAGDARRPVRGRRA